MVVDPNNQQYYDLGEPAPTPAPWFKRSQVQQRALVGALVVMLVGFVGYRIYLTVSFDSAEEDKLNAVEAMLDEAQVRCAEEADPEACMAEAKTTTAEAVGSSAACNGLEGQTLKNCAQLIAIDEADPEACSMIEDEQDKSECEDAAWLMLAKRTDDYAKCAAIVSSTLKSSCEAQLVRVVIAAGECEKYDISAARCSFETDLAAVLASGNPTGCTTFVGGDRETCEDLFTSLDLDKDGLNRLKEYRLGTSDDQADTDGDGYDDGQEVASGYDPLH